MGLSWKCLNLVGSTRMLTKYQVSLLRKFCLGVNCLEWTVWYSCLGGTELVWRGTGSCFPEQHCEAALACTAVRNLRVEAEPVSDRQQNSDYVTTQRQEDHVL